MGRREEGRREEGRRGEGKGGGEGRGGERGGGERIRHCDNASKLTQISPTNYYIGF